MPALAQSPFADKAIETRIRRAASELQMLPAAAMRAMEIAKDPNCSIGEFSAVIERDVKLATDILSMANSVMYSSGTAVISLHQAVSRLGFRQCKNLILTSSLSALMKKLTFQEESIRELLWKHSFVTAMLALHLNRVLGAGFQGEEFTAGLIHDFGRTLFAVGLPEMFSQIDPLTFDESAATLTHEESFVGADHCEVGGWFATANKLPEPLVEVAMYHHEPSQARQFGRIVALTSACDHMANHLQRFGSASGYDPASNEAVGLLEDAGVRDARERFAKSYVQVMDSSARDAAEMIAAV